jgi:hypothetical protein
LFFAHLTLRVATGPLGSEGQKFFAAFVRTSPTPTLACA